MAKTKRKTLFELTTMIRRGSADVLGHDARVRYCRMQHNERLILHREPGNVRDGNAVLVTDVQGQSIGYVAREHAGVVSARLEAGEVLQCIAVGGCMCVFRTIFIWSEGEIIEQEEIRKATKPKIARIRIREKNDA